MMIKILHLILMCVSPPPDTAHILQSKVPTHQFGVLQSNSILTLLLPTQPLSLSEGNSIRIELDCKHHTESRKSISGTHAWQGEILHLWGLK